MTIRKEVLKLIKELRTLEPSSDRWNEIADTLKRKFEMPAYNILALYHNPPALEYTANNKHLLLEPETKSDEETGQPEH